MRLASVLVFLLAACDGAPIDPGPPDASARSDLEFPPCSVATACAAGVCCSNGGTVGACVPAEDCVAPDLVLCATHADCQAALGGGACCDAEPAKHCCEL